MSHLQKADAEKAIQRNPHPDFKKVEASRPDWTADAPFHYTKTVKPDWTPGTGGNDNGESLKKEHVGIDPYEEGRPATFNYKLLISAIVPRPVGFVSTISGDGKSTNLAPFSYFNFISHDPPLFTIGFVGGIDRAKDTLKNLIDTKECCINIISEHFLEAANATSINAPHGTSEWAWSGLHPAPTTLVRPARVKEAIFSIEGKLDFFREHESRATPGKKTGTMVVIEGVKFWAREDAINEDKNIVDPAVLKPISRLGGISYGRLMEGVELPRPDWEAAMKDEGSQEFVKPKAEGQ
ncbi:hypothetical protein K402DRAFT_420842 [Aulographum hederae CBS 113979]|uniref:Flavin reductase like domain-containing protein n=1 Tax=Aulographum hederae CBS 113979 TaxID=1176131 RepID=A0A6G1H1C8_9PEZI|nr:hypothetical protein K402DRAFT_420842 [Aulographum hederae CBS 113979]